MWDGNVGQLHAVKHRRVYVWSGQTGENIHNDDKRETLKKSWVRFKCFRNGRNCSFNENYDGAVAVDGMVDGWYRSKRSKNLKNVAERVKSRQTRKKKERVKRGGGEGYERKRGRRKLRQFAKNLFSLNVEFRCNAET